MSAGAALAPAADASWRARGEAVVAWLAQVGASRRAFWITALLAALLPWLSYASLPMVDIAQHAGQVALWRDLLLGVSPWSDMMRINLFTPYLTGYGIALPFAFVMSPGAALTLVLSAACLGFIAAAVALRRDAGADPRLDWLLVTPFYGFAWQWGFFTFLVVAPVVLVLVRLAWRHAKSSTAWTAAGVAALGLLLLFSHGLAFLFACAVGGALTLAEARSVRGLLIACIPYAVLAAALLAIMLASRGFEAPTVGAGVMWMPDPGPRIATLLMHNHGFAADLAVLSVLVLLVPRLMGLALAPRAAVPLAVLVLVVLTLPHAAAGTFFLFHRFGMFAMPFLVLILCHRPIAAQRGTLQHNAGVAMMVAACWAGIAVMAARLAAFAREAGDFEVVLAAAEPGKRAMGIIADARSAAAGQHAAYLHHASWYQADKGGLVDFNFANFHPQVVRYRPGQAPSAGIGFEWESAKLDWRRHEARSYHYYFVRHGAGPVPPQLLANGECRIETVAAAGAWTLLRRGACSQDGSP